MEFAYILYEREYFMDFLANKFSFIVKPTMIYSWGFNKDITGWCVVISIFFIFLFFGLGCERENI